MEIRRFVREDAKAVAAIRAETIAQLTEHYDREALETWAGSITADDFLRSAESFRRWVAVEGSEILGYGDWNPATKEFAGIYVDPSAQGKGVGSAIYERVEADAREQGAERLWSNATLNARGFYEKHGYSEEGEGYYQAGEFRIRTVMMGKRLAQGS